MICKHCGKEIDDSLSECPYCHAPTVEVEEFKFEEGKDDGFNRNDSNGASFGEEHKDEPPSYCPICGTKVTADMLFCPVCGKNLRGSGFAGGGYYDSGAQKTKTDAKKVYSDAQTIGILSVILWLFSSTVGIILGILAIYYGSKGKNYLAVTLGIIGIALSLIKVAVFVAIMLITGGSITFVMEALLK